jgi:hypothetical protein
LAGLTPSPLLRYTVGMSFYSSNCPAQMANAKDWWKDGKPARATLGDLPRTWRDDRREEFRRRGYGVLMRIVFPREPLRIVRAPRQDLTIG